MIDERLELRLRSDPTGDPVHEVGRFGARVARVAVVRARSKPTFITSLPVAAALAVIVLLGLVAVVRLPNGPAATPPPPSPSPTPLATLAGVDSTRLRGVVETWMGRFGTADVPLVSTTAIGADGVEVSYASDSLPSDPESAVTARLGEVSRTQLLAGIALIDACTHASNPLQCQKPVFGTGLTLDDPVRRWYTAFPASDPTTLRQLAEGSSGLAAIANDLSELSAAVEAQPGADWSRDAALARAIAAPRRFVAGDRREPVDTEAILLEAVIEQAAGGPASKAMPGDGFPPIRTTYADQPPFDLMPGIRLDGTSFTDLDPKVLAVEGNAAGIAASSQDIAELSISIWGSSEILGVATWELFTDVADGRAEPFGAQSRCPCDGGTRLVIFQIGHAVGWTTLMAYDYQRHLAIGVILGRDWPSADLEGLLDELMTL